MKSYYSIVYLSPIIASNEKIAIGLLFVSEGIPLFKYSERKLNIAKKLIEKNSFNSIVKVLDSIKDHIHEFTLNNEMNFLEGSPFSFEYTSYLNGYHNNILTYSDPSKSVGEYLKNDFDDLYRIYIDNVINHEFEENRIDYIRNFTRRIKTSPIKNKIDTFFELRPRVVDSIYSSHKVSYIGVNGRLITGNSLDLNKDPYYIERDLYLYRSLAIGLNQFSEKVNLPSNGNHIVYFNEPEGIRQKEVFDRALKDKNSGITFKPYESFDADEEYILEEDIKRFSDFLPKQ